MEGHHHGAILSPEAEFLSAPVVIELLLRHMLGLSVTRCIYNAALEGRMETAASLMPEANNRHEVTLGRPRPSPARQLSHSHM